MVSKALRAGMAVGLCVQPCGSEEGDGSTPFELVRVAKQDVHAYLWMDFVMYLVCAPSGHEACRAIHIMLTASSLHGLETASRAPPHESAN